VAFRPSEWYKSRKARVIERSARTPWGPPSSGQCLRLDSGKHVDRSRKPDSILGGTLMGGASSAKGSIVILDIGRIIQAVGNAKGYKVPESTLVIHRVCRSTCHVGPTAWDRGLPRKGATEQRPPSLGHLPDGVGRKRVCPLGRLCALPRFAVASSRRGPQWGRSIVFNGFDTGRRIFGRDCWRVTSVT
jgi:hypothetical protein